MKATITKINEVKSNEVLVSLSGMRRDLTDCMSITPSDIKQWFYIDENGDTKQCSIKIGQAIEFDLPSQATRRLKNIVFIKEQDIMKNLDLQMNVGDSAFGAFKPYGQSLQVIDGVIDEELYDKISNGKLIAKADFNDEQKEAWNTIFDNYKELLESEDSYLGLAEYDEEKEDGTYDRAYIIIW